MNAAITSVGVITAANSAAIIALGVTVSAHTTAIEPTDLAVSGLNTDVASINDSIVILESKTKNVDLSLTTATSTCLKNQFKISNISIDKVVLNDTLNGYNYFNTKTYVKNCLTVKNGNIDQVILNNFTDNFNYINTKTIFNNDICLDTDSNIITKNNTILNIGSANQGAINLTVSTLDGVVTITAQTINLAAQYVTVNNESLYNYLAGGFQILVNNNYYTQYA